jgi:SAM-dependent methyltransferase
VRDLLSRYAAGELASPARRAGTPTGSWAIDVGCGTGSMLPVMREWGTPVGVDAYLPALQLVAATPVVAGDLLQLPFPAHRFSLVGCFDVLYHRRVSDVTQALREIHRVCDPDGWVVITDSAFAALSSPHDVANHGARRFRAGELARLLESAGFQVVHRSYFHTLIFPAAAAVRLAQRLRAPRAGAGNAGDVHSDLKPAPEWLNRLLGAVAALESAVVRVARLPFGLSVLLLARPTSVAGSGGFTDNR